MTEPPLSRELVVRIVGLRKEGHSTGEIARKLGMDLGLVRKALTFRELVEAPDWEKPRERQAAEYTPQHREPASVHSAEYLAFLEEKFIEEKHRVRRQDRRGRKERPRELTPAERRRRKRR